MKKGTIIFLSLISIIFSLIYILLNHYGYIRFLMLHCSSIENYIKTYKNLDKIDDNHIIIISLIIHNENANITPTIKSLLDQTVKVHNILLVNYNDSYTLLPSLKKIIATYRISTDNGILNSIISPIKQHGDANIKIITLDTSKIYGVDFIETIIENSIKAPNKIVYINNKTDFIKLENGVLFPITLFKPDFFNIPTDITSNQYINQYFKSTPKIHLTYNNNI